MAIEAGQVYRRYDARDKAWHRIRITDYRPGSDRARVVNAETGKRPRSILVRSLHSGPGPSGALRSSGYTLEPPKGSS